MSVVSSRRNEFQELVSLSWVALGQAQGRAEPVDEATMLFFSSVPSPSPCRASPVPRLPQKNLSEERPVAPPLIVKEVSEEVVPMSSANEEPSLPPSQTRRLEKLLPRASSCTSSDTADVRKKILSKSASGNLSEIQLYKDPAQRTGPKRWTVFTYLIPGQPQTPREDFVRSVIKASEDRLHVQVCEHSCTDPLFALQLPMAVDDSEVVLLFVEAHLESSLLELLEPIQSFARASQSLDHPFSVIGSINGKPLRTMILHPSTHEDQAVKSQLWQSLKALATLKSPY